MFRNEVLLHKCNRQSSLTLGDLVTISGQSRIHQQTLTELFGAVKADSVLLKALSMMATAYLPASLIAVSLHLHITVQAQLNFPTFFQDLLLERLTATLDPLLLKPSSNHVTIQRSESGATGALGSVTGFLDLCGHFLAAYRTYTVVDGAFGS